MSKLVESLNINTVSEFKKAANILKLNAMWSAIFYKIIFNGMSYEKAGKPFSITKHAIYERLKIARKQLNK